jgi:hypothetical protein
LDAPSKQFGRVSLDEALRTPDGHTVLMDASLYFGPRQPPCIRRGASADIQRCFKEGAFEFVGLRTLRPASRRYFDGPLIALVRGGRLYGVAVTHS